jgi:hypothetical protein
MPVFHCCIDLAHIGVQVLERLIPIVPELLLPQEILNGSYVLIGKGFHNITSMHILSDQSYDHLVLNRSEAIPDQFS